MWEDGRKGLRLALAKGPWLVQVDTVSDAALGRHAGAAVHATQLGS